MNSSSPAARNRTGFARIPLALAMAAVTALSGCAVHPRPFSDAEREHLAAIDRNEMFSQQEPLHGPVTLDEALARAIRFNLDHRQKMMEEALAQRQLDLSNFDLLPKLTAAAGYTSRNRELASRSVLLDNPGQTSVPPSYSTDKTVRTADLGFSWNLLDFGVSYYEAKEQADRVLVLQQRRRKVVQLLMQQVREAYWQAAGAERIRDRIGPLLRAAQSALDDSAHAQSLQASPLDALNYRHELLDLMRQLELVRDQLEEAKPRLASLMNLDPGQEFTLAPPAGLEEPHFDMSIAQMETTALERRPELLEAGYNERISVNETHKAMARLLPGIQVELGQHYDSNSFLAFHTWRDAGISVSWNLLNVLNARNIRGAAKAQLEVARVQREALAMAVLTQVHVARTELGAKRRQFELLKQMNDVDQQILQHTRNAVDANAIGKLNEIRAAAGAMMAELRLYESYGELESAYGQLLGTLGLDPVPDTVQSHDLAALERAIAEERMHWGELGRGPGGKS